MNIAYLSYRNILSKPLSSFLSWLLLAFGVTVVVLILLISSQLKQQISNNSRGIDLVIGAKGSPLQIILSNIFHVDFPTGNIDLKEAASVSRSRYIERAIPLSLGDSYKGYRIVGTTKAYSDLYDATFKEGSWASDHMQVVIGSRVANETGLQIGDTFSSQHGLSEEGEAHGEHPFEVKGILAQTGSVLDGLILTKTRSIWEVHGHEEEGTDSLINIEHLGLEVTVEQFENEQITSLLVKYRSPMGAVMLPRTINAESNLQAASPAYETARLFNIIGTAVNVLNILGVLIIVISAVSVFVALLNSLKDRQYDIAVMRSMGATRRQIFLNVFIEGLLITFAGGVSGLLTAHLLVVFLASSLEGFQAGLFFFVEQEWMVLVGCLLIGMLASLFPAVLAYKTDISKTLAKA